MGRDRSLTRLLGTRCRLIGLTSERLTRFSLDPPMSLEWAGPA